MTACTRSRRPSLPSRLETWRLAVGSATTSAAAISALDRPPAISCRTSRSRSVKAATPAVGDAVEQLPRDLRAEDGIAVRDRLDGGDQLLARDVLGQEAAGARAQRLDDVLVEAKGREHEDLEAREPARRLEAVHD